MADLPPLLEGQPLNGPPPENLGPGLATKRQRRPSVRLGDIGEQPAAAVSFEAQARRATKQWRIPPHMPKDPAGAGRGSSRTRALMTLGNGDCQEALDGEDRTGPTETHSDPAAVGFRKPKEFRGKRGGGAVTKRVRSNWIPRVDEGHEGAVDKLGGEDDELRDFDVEGSDSPLKESPLRSPPENMDLERGHDRRLVRARVTETREPEPEPVEMDVPSDDNTDRRDWRRGPSVEGNGGSERRGQGMEDGVRMWLNELGLGRYAPVFEIHEVDEEVLPLLTLEDLKDMGINAVGSRRKMYSAIQKLARGLS